MSLDNLNAVFLEKPQGGGRNVKNGRFLPRPRAKAGPEAAGSAVPVNFPKVMRTLLDSITDDDIDGVARAWREALGATTRVYDSRLGDFVISPDHNTRMKAGQLIAAYREGLPVARQIQLQGRFEDLGETLKLLGQSPAATAALARLGGVIDIDSETLPAEKGTE